MCSEGETSTDVLEGCSRIHEGGVAAEDPLHNLLVTQFGPLAEDSNCLKADRQINQRQIEKLQISQFE